MLEDYNYDCLKNFQQIEQKRKCVLAKFPSFVDFVTLKSYLWNLTTLIDAFVSVTADVICRR